MSAAQTWAGAIDDVETSFQQWGIKATHKKQGTGTYNIATGKAPATPTSVTRYLMDVDTAILRDKDSQKVGQTTKFIASAKPTNVPIQVGDRILVNGIELSVLEANPCQPGGVVLFYDIVAVRI